MFSKVGKDKSEDTGKGKEWFFLLLSVVLAAIAWLVYSLSLSYNVFLDYPVRITTNLPGFESSAYTDQHAIVRAKADGFYIVDRKLASRKNPVEIEVDGKYLVPLGNEPGFFAVESRNISQEFSNVLGNNVTLEYLVTDTLTVRLKQVAAKKVPVAMNLNIECASQYRVSSPVSVSPDSVFISGDESLISSIDSVWTENVSLSGISDNVEGIVPINKIKGVELSSVGVVYSFSVTRYVEEKVSLPVVVQNLPPDRKVVLLPDKVDVTFIRFYPIAGELSAKDFECSVDYDDFMSTPSFVTIPVITKKPAGTTGFILKPEMVECIVLDR